jgi:dienelactone hydrolase
VYAVAPDTAESVRTARDEKDLGYELLLDPKMEAIQALGLKADERVDPERTAAIGYCFGGGCVLELARSGADVDGVVSFHGNLDTPNPDKTRKPKASILACHGAADPHVPMKDVETFAEEMHRCGADWQLNMYGGAVHAFTNPDSGDDPSKGAAHDETAATRAWEDMKQFFGEVIGQ